jgi:hypothetical protein
VDAPVLSGLLADHLLGSIVRPIIDDQLLPLGKVCARTDAIASPSKSRRFFVGVITATFMI